MQSLCLPLLQPCQHLRRYLGGVMGGQRIIHIQQQAGCSQLPQIVRRHVGDAPAIQRGEKQRHSHPSQQRKRSVAAATPLTLADYLNFLLRAASDFFFRRTEGFS